MTTINAGERPAESVHACLLAILEKMPEPELTARKYVEQLHEHVDKFLADFPPDHEIFVTLAGFRDFRVHSIRCRMPYTVIFYGQSSYGSECEVAQHVSQVGIKLTAVQRVPDEPRITIKFDLKNGSPCCDD